LQPSRKPRGRTIGFVDVSDAEEEKVRNKRETNMNKKKQT